MDGFCQVLLKIKVLVVDFINVHPISIKILGFGIEKIALESLRQPWTKEGFWAQLVGIHETHSDGSVLGSDIQQQISILAVALCSWSAAVQFQLEEFAPVSPVPRARRPFLLRTYTGKHLHHAAPPSHYRRSNEWNAHPYKRRQTAGFCELA